MEESATYLNEYIIPWGIRIFIALAIYVIGKMLAGMVTNMTRRALTRSGLDDMLVKFLGNLVYVVLLAAVVLAALSKLGINITSLLAILGAAGLAVGLALKDSLSNFAAGVMIIIFRPFQINDFIEAGGAAGTVVEIGMFCTLLNTPDNKRIIVPNSAVIGGNITNVNTLGTRRVDMVIGISYDDNIGQARDIIMGILKADSRVLPSPEPVVAVGALGDSSVNINVRPWVKSEDYWTVLADTQENVKTALEEAGLSIPYPQQDVYMHNVA